VDADDERLELVSLDERLELVPLDSGFGDRPCRRRNAEMRSCGVRSADRDPSSMVGAAKPQFQTTRHQAPIWARLSHHLPYNHLLETS